MTPTLSALEKVISELPIGVSYVLPTKADIKELIYKHTGHYPRQGEFDRALETLLKTSNHLNFGYMPGWGWYRSETGLPFMRSMDKQIKIREIKIQAYGL